MSEMSEILKKFPEMKKEDSLRISGYLNLIGAIVLERSSFGNERNTDGVLCQRVFSYLVDNFSENISLSQVAKRLGYNEKYLSHTLHSLTGVHFRKLLNSYRIDHAKKLLTGSCDMNISEIAASCGFNSLNTFNREFKTIVGVTPSEYRGK